MASGVAPGAGGPCGRMPRGRRRRGLMTFLPARTRGAPGWDLCTAWIENATMLRVEPVSAPGDGRVPFTVHRTRGSNALACWLPMGGVAARPGVTAARLPRCGSRGANLYGDQVRCGQRLAPWASAFRSLSPKLRARNLHARTPSRQYKVEARFAWRAGGGGADSKRGDCWSAAPPRGR